MTGVIARSAIFVVSFVGLAGCAGETRPGAVGIQAGSPGPVPVEPRQNDPTAAAGPASMPSTPTPSAPSNGLAPPSAPSADEPAQPPPSRIGARHVLVQFMGTERAPASVVRTREQALTLAQEVLKRARAGQDMTRLAVEYSDEPGAGARGGSLGRFGHGQMVPAFEEAVFKLKVGQISDIVETSFGFHVIQRTE